MKSFRALSPRGRLLLVVVLDARDVAGLQANPPRVGVIAQAGTFDEVTVLFGPVGPLRARLEAMGLECSQTQEEPN